MENIKNFSHPFVLRDADWGPCLKWTAPYLADSAPNLRVSVHRSDSSFLDYGRDKNFSYEVCSFKEFMTAVQTERYLYYRALHTKVKKPASLEIFGEKISADFRVPLLPENSKIHSTVLRVGSPGLAVWLHYDMCDNFLLQISGNKKVILYPPTAVRDLQIKGSSSEIPCEYFFNDKLNIPGKVEFDLLPGEAVFIPALWFHTTKAGEDEVSIGVNVFFIREQIAALHADKDIWANKDFPAFTDAVDKIEQIRLHMPEPYRSFYRMKLLDALDLFYSLLCY